jgi:hypothetical protein
MFSSVSLSKIFISLLLFIAAVEGHSHRREHIRHVRHLSPKGFRINHMHEKRQQLNGSTTFTTSSTAIETSHGSYNNYTSGRWTVQSTASAAPAVAAKNNVAFIFQTTTATVTAAVYQICEISESGCLTAYQTKTTSLCSTVLTGFFTRVTVSDCNQNITFSTRRSYSLTSTVVPALTTAVARRQAASTSTFVQSVVSYYVAPWQSIAANTPTGITVVVCTVSATGVEDCLRIQEVWVVHTEYIPVMSTSTVSINDYFTKVWPSGPHNLSLTNFWEGVCSPVFGWSKHPH